MCVRNFPKINDNKQSPEKKPTLIERVNWYQFSLITAVMISFSNFENRESLASNKRRIVSIFNARWKKFEQVKHTARWCDTRYQRIWKETKQHTNSVQILLAKSEKSIYFCLFMEACSLNQRYPFRWFGNIFSSLSLCLNNSPLLSSRRRIPTHVVH